MTRKELFEKWIKALRSGQYKQGRGALQKHGNYCCLGVLCDVAGRKVEDWPRGFGEPATKEWLQQTIGDTAFMCFLAEINDDGVPFNDIASGIEANILKVSGDLYNKLSLGTEVQV